MIETLLVANRGEIARRVFRTARRMGISTVAVYADPDRGEPFVAEADRAFALGGTTPAESYLWGEGILEAARITGADAIHPGYGFLAENADFATSVVQAGLKWVGPPPTAIETMGSKLASKEAVTDAGVPTLPTHDLSTVSDEKAGSLAEDLGYPVLVKASAGGGGKGMRVVAGPGELADALTGARREAEAAFGDPTIFLERYLDRARHIEIQILADTHGTIISCGERECSIQRRHQKIIEEAPSPVIDAETRERLGDAAVTAARSVDYTGAGTVEFLFQDGDFSFLEMNTRLQVEHPVTEEVQGIDLVEWQLRIADDEAIPDALISTPVGSSIEARIYAEDPANGYLPSTGVLSRFDIDEDLVRVDSGVETGSTVGIDYDPMLAKVVAWSPDRRRTAAILAQALRRARVAGVTTNIGLLVNILEHEEFVSGAIDTLFLERHPIEEVTQPLLDEDESRRCAVAAAIYGQLKRRDEAAVQTTIPSGWRNNPSQPQVTTYLLDGVEVDVRYRVGRDGHFDVDAYESASIIAHDHDSIVLELDSLTTTCVIDVEPDATSVFTSRGSVKLRFVPRHPMANGEVAAGSLRAPMPGRIIEVLVTKGEVIEKGTPLLVMEAMKMEHTLRAPTKGTVSSIAANVGDQVEADTVLIVIDEPGDS
ncbi:MAG: ATP-grasp domain-containing protein [Acidimicrobiia bacterium]|nr:ATP-grasp domain-containing protein [Acidimicrobiia bacterium]